MTIDPEQIQPGQRVHFVCPEETCTFHFWKYWQPNDAVNRFADPRCHIHNPPVLMTLTEVKDAETD